MDSYETNIGRVDNSVFAIGRNARAQGRIERQDHDLAEALQTVLSVVREYTDPAAIEATGLSMAAIRQIEAGQPEKDVFARLVDAARKVLGNLGAGLAEAGTLAEAVTRISEVTRHL